MHDYSVKDVSEAVLATKKQKLPASRSLFAIGLGLALGLLLWFKVVGLGAAVIICFLYVVYLLVELSEAIYDQLYWLRYEAAQHREHMHALAQMIADNESKKSHGQRSES